MKKEHLLTAGVSFVWSACGIFARPYETYRRIVNRGSLLEYLFIGAVVLCYLVLVAVVKTSVFRPYLLTKQFILLLSGAMFGVLLSSTLLWFVGRRVGGRGSLEGVVLGWGYGLIPTVLWFFLTSVLYVLLPPPRTTRFLGVLFSVIYLSLSGVLFFYKAMCVYLTLRFGMKMDMAKIFVTLGISLPVLFLYSVLMYQLNIYKIPFL